MAIYDARAWVELDLGSLRANYHRIRRAAGDAAVVPMVKADAYGLGVERVIPALERVGPWGYGVATAVEGRRLRDLGVERPILVAGPLPPADVEAAARAGLTPSISAVEELDAWARAVEGVDHREGRTGDFHVEIDTGMGRSGFDWRRVEAWAPAVAERTGRSVRWAGVFTHFHSADVEAPAATMVQWERFQATLVQLPVPRASLMVHAAASGAALRWPELVADAVRPGVFLYGGKPAPALDGLPSPAPVVSVRARLVRVRSVPAGSTVGYGATHVAGSEERWGTLSIGYGDGYPRAVGNRAEALVRGRRVPVIGRVSMDLTTVLLDDVPDASVGDVATLIGDDGSESVTVDDVARWAGTISYEVLTSLGTRLPRMEVGTTEASETE